MVNFILHKIKDYANFIIYFVLISMHMIKIPVTKSAH